MLLLEVSTVEGLLGSKGGSYLFDKVMKCGHGFSVRGPLVLSRCG